MNYTIYCNEKLVIENLPYYKECNLKMKQLLAKSGLPHERCYELYMQNINSKGGMPDKDYTLRYFKEKCTNKNRLRCVDKINIYQSDMDYFVDACRYFDLNASQKKILFGVIFMCRMDDKNYIDLRYETAIKGFCHSCHDKHIYKEGVKSSGWFDSYCEPSGMTALCDAGLLKRVENGRGSGEIGCKYIYPQYDKRAGGVAVCYVVGLENNRLDIGSICQEMGLYDLKFCSKCGKEFYARGNKRIYCKECAAKIHREKNKENMRRARQNRRVRIA